MDNAFCSNCGAEIAPTSRFCASCGTKCVVEKPMPPTKSNWKVWVWVVGAFVGLILLAAIISHTSGPDSKTQSSSSETASSQHSTSSEQVQADNEKWFKGEIVTPFLLGQVKDRLKDPDSAKFRNVTLFHDFVPRSDGDGRETSIGGYALCGEVNARNGFGGYDGYTQFVSMTWVWTNGEWPGLSSAASSRGVR